MQPITKYAEQNDKIRLLLQGPPGSGKTTLACQFPNAYVIDLDVNLGGTLRWLKGEGLKLPVGFDVVDQTPEGVPIPMKERFKVLQKCIEDVFADPNVDTVIFDSGTKLVDVLLAEVLRLQNKEVMTKQEWGVFFAQSKKFMEVLAKLRKHIILIVHEKTLTSEAGAVVYPIKAAWPGQFGQIIGAFFTNVWRCEVQEKVSDKKHRWLVRTLPNYQYELKNTLSPEVPAMFDFDWNVIQKALDKGKLV